MNFTRQLLQWYKENKRDLPWRRTRDPYLIWLSEIILQQTRIDQGLPYYQKFVEAFPTVQDLATANEQDVLKLWQGLGYYSRARNLHAAARVVVKEHGGIFPDSYAGIRSLKGVGDYTAAAIASIVFDLPYPVVDGNVLRFLSRYFGIGESIALAGTKKQILEIAREHLDQANPGDFNQGMMEFGARVCTPANPDCISCLFNHQCFAFKHGQVGRLPFNDARVTVRNRFIHYLVITLSDGKEDFIYLNQRSGNDIWRNLYDFPHFESDRNLIPGKPLNQASVQEFFKSGDFLSNELSAHFHPADFRFTGASRHYKHILTHQKLDARFYRFHSDHSRELPFHLVPLKKIWDYPVPRLIEKYITDHFPKAL